MEAAVTHSERRTLVDAWKKNRRKEKLTEREEATLACLPYLAAAHGSFASVARTGTEQKSRTYEHGRPGPAQSWVSGCLSNLERPRMAGRTVCQSEPYCPERFTASGSLCHT
jgi:hypothetical protein